jgi:hypothetical protein
LQDADRLLYHQIHPLKLLTDGIAGFAGLYPLWRHELVLALAIIAIPPAIVSFALVRFVDLDGYRRSAFGRYLARYMTPLTQAVRFLGYVLMAAGAWFHLWYAIPTGLLVILLAWLRGKISPAS